MIYYIYSDYAFDDERLSELFPGEKFVTDKATKQQCQKLVKLGMAVSYKTMADFEIAFNEGYISDQGAIRTF